MKNRFQIKSFVIATFFLVAYSNVFAKQLVCNWTCLFDQTTKSAQHDDDCNDCDEKTPAQHQHDGKDEKEKPCCNDKTTAFFASQGNHIISAFDFKDPSVKVCLFTRTIFVYSKNIVSSKDYVSYSLPPPKIPDIRVFIQSFII